MVVCFRKANPQSLAYHQQPSEKPQTPPRFFQTDTIAKCHSLSVWKIRNIHRELLLFAQRHRKVMNHYNDFSRGYQWGLEESQNMIFQYVKKILEL